MKTNRKTGRKKSAYFGKKYVSMSALVRAEEAKQAAANGNGAGEAAPPKSFTLISDLLRGEEAKQLRAGNKG